MTELGSPPAWEYTYLEGSTGRLVELIGVLNDMATDGWELVSAQSADTPAGGNWTTLFLRREIVPLPRPHSLDEGWYPDPTGRFSGRFWNGEAWTFHVSPDLRRTATLRHGGCRSTSCSRGVLLYPGEHRVYSGEHSGQGRSEADRPMRVLRRATSSEPSGSSAVTRSRQRPMARWRPCWRGGGRGTWPRRAVRSRRRSSRDGRLRRRGRWPGRGPAPPPSRLRASSSRVNRSKTRSRSMGSMPGPSSSTRELDRALVLRDGDRDGGAGVSDSVAQQVVEQALEVVGATVDLSGDDGCRVDRHRTVRTSTSHLREHDLVEIDWVVLAGVVGLLLPHE